MADKVKCLGCGSMVWAGAKMHDGYCHDCYVRGRHLPPDTDDNFLQPHKKKKPAPKLSPTNTRRKWNWPLPFRVIGRWFRWYTWQSLLAVLILAGIIFGITPLGDVLSRFQSEASAMNSIRNERASNFYNRGAIINHDAVIQNKAAFIEYINSGASYRMIGIITYAHDYMNPVRARTDIELSYNGGLDVHKFIISNSGADEKLGEFQIPEGTYYIVNENDIPYVLVHAGGKRTVIDPSEDDEIYHFLLGYSMNSVMYYGFMGDYEETSARSLRDGAYYARPYSGTGLSPMRRSHRIELRTYKDRPVYYYYCNINTDLDVEYELILNFYYDNIPNDNPSVSEYK